MNRLKAILAALAALAATVAGLDLTGITSLLPPDAARALVIIPSAAAVIAHLVSAIGLQFEKAKADIDKIVPAALIMLGISLMALSMPACVTTTSPDGTEMKRMDGEAWNPFLTLARDLFVKPPVATPAEVEPTK
jgi:hypothetical protein